MEITEKLKEKVHKAVAEQKFVGLVQYSENEYQELLAYTSKHSRAFAFGYGSYLYGDDEIIFATLVEIAKRWKSNDDSDKGFWLYIFKVVLDSGDNPKLWRAYTDLINDLEYRNKIVVANTAKKYYATIMMHAFAPYKSMIALFDFVYNIYKKDLNFDYTDVDREICDIATEGFCNVAKSLGGKNVDVSIGSGAYGIKIGLRCLALGNGTRKYFVSLLDRVLDSVDRLYHGDNLSSDDYLIQLIKDWWEAKAEKDLTATHVKHIAATTKQNITIKFIHKESNVYLCIPPIRFAVGEDPNLWLSIYVENRTEPVITKEIFTQRGEITVTSVQQEIELNNLLHKANEFHLRIEITENGKELFNKTIDRDFLLFDNEKELTNSVLKVGNYFVYSLSVDDLQTPISISTIAKNLYNIYPTERETLGGRQKQVVFTNVSDWGIVSNKIQLIGESGICKWEYKDKICKVFGNWVNLLVPNSMSINGLELRIDGKCTLLSNLAFTPEDEYTLFDITDLIPQRVPCELVVYYHLKEKEVIHDYIVSIQKLHIGFSKPIYYGNDERQVRVSLGGHFRDLEWSLGDETVSCHLCNGRLNITIPQFKWRIDVGDWHYGPVDDVVWYKDYFNSGSILEVQSPIDVNTIRLYCVGDGAIQEIPQNSSSRFEIGKYIFANEGRKVLAFFFKSIESADRKEICETTTEERFTTDPLIVTNGNLQFIGEKYYIGLKKSWFNICLKRIGRDEINVKSTELNDGIIEDIDEGIYWAKVSALSGGLFGGVEKLLWEDEIVLGDREKLKLSNIVLKINPIRGIGNGDFWKVSTNGYYISNLVRMDAPDTYSAKLYYRDARGERSDVSGFSDCCVEIISPIALQVLVKGDTEKYTERLKCDNSGNLYGPQSQQQFSVTNYHFIEVKNV